MTGCRSSLATNANVVARTMAYAIWTRMSACICAICHPEQREGSALHQVQVPRCARDDTMSWRGRGLKGTMVRIPIPAPDMSIDAPDTTYDRRKFMAYFGALGLSSTLLPGVLWAQANQQQGTPITKE